MKSSKHNLVDWFQSVVATFPNHAALQDDHHSLSYRELDALSDQIAIRLQDCRHVAILMEHSFEMIATMLGVLKAGAAYVPIEPGFPSRRIEIMLAEASVDQIVTDASHADDFAGLSSVAPIDVLLARLPKPFTPRPIASETPAYILYTSGTTGRPKGVCVTHGNVCHYVRAFQHEFHPGPRTRMLQSSVCTFDIFVEEVFTTLLSGGTLVIPDGDTRRDFHALMDFCARHRCTSMSVFPVMVERMNEENVVPRGLKLLISGGDVLRASQIDRIRDKVVVYDTYGPSETTVCCSYYNASRGEALADGTFPIGHPVLDTMIRILDKAGNEVPEGCVGEICIEGGGVSLGYIGDHAKENEAFVTRADGSRLYRSGDLGYVLPDHNLAFLHRKDRQIMIEGKRVEPDEVESVLHQYPDVKQAAVLVWRDKMDRSHMKAFIVFRNGQSGLAGLKPFLARYLTPFMIPEQFEIRDRLPMTANGKVDYKALERSLA
ncbi:amino acid adenylation domain-containing protein [uncultured Dubosiella sp.]|uniref:amino acid adenylation domain-containing protein n=1 Tax=uncultured Dubosiella sp. TaxID=1937011 RepID=UPI0025B4FDA6|nr:amino acid adenylation domain-containing protein [uncultured Dubosiella sp.]